MTTSSRSLLTTISFGLVLIVACAFARPVAAATPNYEYRLIFASETSQLLKDINQGAKEGFRAAFMTAGRTEAGDQILVLMAKDKGSGSTSGYQYQLLVGWRTSLVEKAMNQSALNGFQYRAFTIVNYIIILMEKASGPPATESEYRVVTANRRATKQKEVDAAAEQGFRVKSVGPWFLIMSRPKGLDKARYAYNLGDAAPASTDDGFVLSGFFEFGWRKTGYVMEKDLNKAPEKTAYTTLSISQAEEVQAKLRLAQRDGFCFVDALLPPAPFTGYCFVMKKTNERCDHTYLEDPDYYKHGQSYEGWVPKGGQHLAFLDELNKWGNKGYEVVGFSSLKAVMIKSQD